MAASTENITRWIEQTDIDYYTYFIKAWIPFNAWYNASYSTLDSDRAKINSIKKEPADRIRKTINAYLENNGQEGQDFRNYLAALHSALEQAQLESGEGRISFTQIVKEKNLDNCIDNEEVRRIKYYLKREDGKRLGEITKFQVFVKANNGNTIFSYEHNEYDLSHLQKHSKFVDLRSSQQETVRLFFEKLNPVIITDIIEKAPEKNPKKPQNYYLCDLYHFKRDLEETNCYAHIVIKAIIESLYQLRNILFHGELTPTQNASQVYKNAYFLLKMLLDKIK